uniref:Putative secreted peptide n=1 Tax=Anopheles braziliensis TaxID=58242 RepID=A0A2M3ZNP4_9DIPT
MMSYDGVHILKALYYLLVMSAAIRYRYFIERGRNCCSWVFLTSMLVLKNVAHTHSLLGKKAVSQLMISASTNRGKRS